MKRFFIICVFCPLVNSGYAQIKTPKQSETLQKIQVPKGRNIFLNARAALELYKKTNISANPAPPAPAGNPQNYTFIWPQMKDGENALYFNTPIFSVSNDAISLTDGDFIIQIPNCQSPGFYMLQINCSFQNSGNAEMKLAASDAFVVTRQQASASMSVTQYQETTFVLGVSLIQGMNLLRLNCLNNKWNFYSLRISPVQ